MNKNEILEKAQKSNKNKPDEMELQVAQKGSIIALGSMCVFVLILMTAKIFADESWYDLYSIVFIANGSQHLYKGIKLHQKHEIVLGVLFSLIAIMALVCYIVYEL